MVPLLLALLLVPLLAMPTASSLLLLLLLLLLVRVLLTLRDSLPAWRPLLHCLMDSRRWTKRVKAVKGRVKTGRERGSIANTGHGEQERKQCTFTQRQEQQQQQQQEEEEEQQQQQQ